MVLYEMYRNFKAGVAGIAPMPPVDASKRIACVPQ
jgi:hypothetical protein